MGGASKVRDNRIDGVVQVSNSSTDIFDLTFIVEAVAEDGRATAIGYEHFKLKPGTTDFKIPFGNTLPYGAYTINADAIAEVAARNAILRQRLETPRPCRSYRDRSGGAAGYASYLRFPCYPDYLEAVALGCVAKTPP